MSLPSFQYFTTEIVDDDIVIVGLKHSLLRDEADMRDARKELLSLVDNYNFKRIIIEGSKVRLMFSLFIGALISLRVKVIADNGKLVLCKFNETIRDTFKMTKMNTLFIWTEDEDEAIQAASA